MKEYDFTIVLIRDGFPGLRIHVKHTDESLEEAKEFIYTTLDSLVDTQTKIILEKVEETHAFYDRKWR